MRILIIGGTGLISTPLTRFLVERGAEVTLYNRGRTRATLPAGVEHIAGDRREYAAFEAQMADAGRFDAVIDMVGYATADAASLVRAFRGRVGHLVFCSTVDVYAKPASCYPTREDEPRRPVSDYGKAKARCEELLLAAHQRGDFPVTVLRPAYTYGEGRGLLHTFGYRTTYLDRIRRGLPIIVHGDGRGLWVACHAEDVGRAFAAAAGNATAFGNCYNVAGEEAMTWNQYTVRVAEAMGVFAPPLVHIPTDLLAQALPRRARLVAENLQYPNLLDNSAARRDLEFGGTMGFVEGARRVIRWLGANGKIESSEEEPFYDLLVETWQRLGAGLVEAMAGAEDIVSPV